MARSSFAQAFIRGNDTEKMGEYASFPVITNK
jgi:hypothetical protein